MYCLSSHRKLITILYILHNINDNIKDGNWAMIFVGLCFHYLILVLWLYDEHACINCNWVTVGTFKWMTFSAKWKLNGYLDVFGDVCCHIISVGAIQSPCEISTRQNGTSESPTCANNAAAACSLHSIQSICGLHISLIPGSGSIAESVNHFRWQ